jgi:hypothetical protein
LPKNEYAKGLKEVKVLEIIKKCREVNKGSENHKA